MFNYDETKTLATINVPMLVVWGATDIATRPVVSDRMTAELPQAELVTIKRGGHMALMEQNQGFAEAVSAFCATCTVIGN